MKIVFIVLRTVYYRHFGPLIAEGLKRGYIIECWHDYRHSKEGMKGYLFPNIEESPFYDLGHDNLIFRKINIESDYESLILEYKDVDYYVSLHPLTKANFSINSRIIKQLCGKWCIVMHGPDTFIEMKHFEDLLYYNYEPLFFVRSDFSYNYGRAWLEKFYPGKAPFLTQNRTQAISIGTTMHSQYNKSIDTNELRRKYGIPAGKNILIYLPFPYLSSRYDNKEYGWQAAYAGLYINEFIHRKQGRKTFRIRNWFFVLKKKLDCLKQALASYETRKWLFNGWSEPAVIGAVRRFCDKNNLHLVVKSRRKFPFPEHVYNNADVVIDDDESQQYPSKLQELFSIAELTIGCVSSAVLESIYHEVPFVNLEIPESVFQDEDSRYWNDYGKGSMYNYPGAVYNISVPRMISEFGEIDKSGIKMDQEARKRYMEKFTGPELPTATEKFYEILESQPQPVV